MDGRQRVNLGGTTAGVEPSRVAPGQYHISDIFTEAGARGQGTASTVMKAITGGADRAGVVLRIDPLDTTALGSTGLNTEQLRAFYQRHGFVGDGGMMVRAPQSANALSSSSAERAIGAAGLSGGSLGGGQRTNE